MVQTISAGHMAEQQTGSKLESDQELLHVDVLLNMKSNNEWQFSITHIFSQHL